MPELPEVETVMRALQARLVGRRLVRVDQRRPDLRFPLPPDLPVRLAGRGVAGFARRAKFIQCFLDDGWAILLHLGMSGSVRVLPSETPLVDHDHIDILLDSGLALRFNDPRRFGSLLWTRSDPLTHPLLVRLAPEPLEPAFDADYLYAASRRRRVAIKQFLMNSHVVVGVGNIYAS